MLNRSTGDKEDILSDIILVVVLFYHLFGDSLDIFYGTKDRKSHNMIPIDTFMCKLDSGLHGV
jgi:hypothetical protein